MKQSNFVWRLTFNRISIKYQLNLLDIKWHEGFSSRKINTFYVIYKENFNSVGCVNGSYFLHLLILTFTVHIVFHPVVNLFMFHLENWCQRNSYSNGIFDYQPRNVMEHRENSSSINCCVNNGLEAFPLLWWFSLNAQSVQRSNKFNKNDLKVLHCKMMEKGFFSAPNQLFLSQIQMIILNLSEQSFEFKR